MNKRPGRPGDPSESGARVYDLDLEVRYAETDRMGVVHHANYLIWFEAARTALCATTPWPYARIEDELGVWLMVTGAHVEYRGGATYGDTPTVSAWVDRYMSRILHFGYRVTLGNETLVTGVTEHLWVRAGDKSPCRIPGELTELFKELAGEK